MAPSQQILKGILSFSGFRTPRSYSLSIPFKNNDSQKLFFVKTLKAVLQKAWGSRARRKSLRLLCKAKRTNQRDRGKSGIKSTHTHCSCFKARPCSFLSPAWRFVTRNHLHITRNHLFKRGFCHLPISDTNGQCHWMHSTERIEQPAQQDKGWLMTQNPTWAHIIVIFEECIVVFRSPAPFQNSRDASNTILVSTTANVGCRYFF